MNPRLLALGKKEVLLLLRDPIILVIFLSAVTVQLVLFGSAANTRVQDVPVLYVDQDQSANSRRFIQALGPGGYFNVIGEATDEGELREALAHGRAEVGIVLPEGFSRPVGAEHAVGAQYIEPLPMKIYLDGTRASTALLARGYLAGIVRNFIEDVVALREVEEVGAQYIEPLPPEIEPRYTLVHNSQLKDAFFMIPGVIGVILNLIVTALAATAFARERETGTLASVQMSPIRPLEFLFGKSIPLFVVALIHSVIGFAVGCLWFRIPITGSLTVLLAATLCFLSYCIALGFLAASISRTQYQAIATTSLVVVPAIFLSGGIFPVENWPLWLQGLARINPLYYYVSLSRSVLVTEMGWTEVWPHFGPLLFAAFLFMTLSIAQARRFFISD